MNPIRILLLTLGCLLCIVATTKADQFSLQTSFVAPGTSLGYYSAGSSVGSPDSFLVNAGPVTVVSNPCVAAGGVAQCLQLTQSGSTVPDLASNASLGPGIYDITFLLAGGPKTTNVVLQVAGVLSTTDQVSANSPFAPFQLLYVQIPGGTSSRIEITGGGDALVEGVLATPVGLNTTPEPTSWGLFLMGCLLALPLRRALIGSS